MPPDRRTRKPGPEDRTRAEHMLALAKEAIAQFDGVSETEFAARRLYQTSLAWYLQGIGEAASRISDASRALIPGIPWTQVVGTRHILSHEYDRLVPTKLWHVLRVHLPPMVKALEANVHLLPAPPAE
ncbi:MAG: DUF86 domain-containing protein [Phycisphaerales bacterium]|nr:DUF86 domain-containing protein [Phycisphaerales bacterium]